jgi:hypothetical protein
MITRNLTLKEYDPKTTTAPELAASLEREMDLRNCIKEQFQADIAGTFMNLYLSEETFVEMVMDTFKRPRSRNEIEEVVSEEESEGEENGTILAVIESEEEAGTDEEDENDAKTSVGDEILDSLLADGSVSKVSNGRSPIAYMGFDVDALSK